MTRDDIIRMAIKCQLVTTGNRDGIYMDALFCFAALVAAAEREACALEVLATPEPDTRAIHCTVKCPKCSHYFPAPLRADMRRLIKDDHREAIVNAIRARGVAND